MKIAIGSDHAGFLYKEQIRAWLQDQRYEITDLGTHSEAPIDGARIVAIEPASVTIVIENQRQTLRLH